MSPKLITVPTDRVLVVATPADHLRPLTAAAVSRAHPGAPRLQVA
jgi:hypothetical protein